MAVKRKISIKKIARFAILLVLFIIVVSTIVKALINADKKASVKVVSELKDYNYVLKDNSTQYFHDLFYKLEDTLEKEEINEEEYAKLVGQLFLTDFFTLDNKTNKNDVGGIQFVYKDYQKDFASYASDSVYRSIENNLIGERNQQLPIVSEVIVLNIEQKEYQYSETKKDDKTYVIDLKINYKKDLDYQQKATLFLVHEENKLVVVELQ